MQYFTDCQQITLESVLKRGEYKRHAMNPEDLEWFVYVVECRDKSFYTGIAKNVSQRIDQHNEGKGAKYTRGRGPVRLLAQTGPFSHGEALRLERSIKKCSKPEKLTMLSSSEPNKETK